MVEDLLLVKLIRARLLVLEELVLCKDVVDGSVGVHSSAFSVLGFYVVGGSVLALQHDVFVFHVIYDLFATEEPCDWLAVFAFALW